jgi:hypothetical protein
MSKQNRRSFITTTALIGTGLAASALPSLNMKDEKKIIHHVFFWLKNPAFTKDREALIAGLKTLKKIKTIRDIYIGVPAATEKRSVIDDSYSVSELIFFDDLDSQKAYQDDPIHQNFIEDGSHLWEKVVVYDTVNI